MNNRVLVPILSLLSVACLAVAGTAWMVRQRTVEQRSQPVTQALAPGFAEVPDFELVERSGETVRGSQLRGKVWIAGFIFTRCHHTCPMVTGMMARLRSELPADVRLVSFSVDPENDTPEVLREYAKGFDEHSWWFLTGDRDRLYTLIREGFKLGVRKNPDFGKLPGELISHSTRLALVDRQGNIRGYFDSADPAQMDQIKRRSKELLNE